MAKRNFYEVLGVPKTASADDIRKAYRKLARQLHPDVNKSKDAPARFNEVQEAYDTLSDEQKRKLYDQYGENYERARDTARPGRPPGGGHYTWANVGEPGGAASPDFDMDDLGSVFETLFSGGRGAPFGARGASPGRAGRPAPAELQHDLHITFMTAARGGTEHLKLSQNGKSRTVEVKIPAGVNEGAQLRMRGAAPDGGDLILLIHVGEHPLFRRGEGRQEGRGLDLYLDLPLTVAEAALGATVNVPTLGEAVELSVPPASSSGRRLRLRGRGIKDAEGRQGDLYVVVRVMVPDPKSLTESERAMLRDISARQSAPRAGEGWPEPSSD